MAGIAHISTGFAGKWIAPRVPLWVLLIASELIDLLWIVFWFTGLEGINGAPWSHSLAMSLVWSVLAGGIVAAIYRHIKSGLAVGLIVFSHWIIDYITHPMGAVLGGEPLPNDLFLSSYTSPQVGLGLYNENILWAYIFEIVITAAGVALYLLFRKKRGPAS